MTATPRPRKTTPRLKKNEPDPNVVQRQASDPNASVWVTASAGTGKTKVLTDRTLRLMLAGSRPDQILCLTFTRAAASVMIDRIRDELGTWATCDAVVLDEKLTRLMGAKPDDATRRRARQLFAEFLDAHGGMRIQTIHSFSQSLLRRFPIESGIPPYFDVMDDQTVAEELRAAQAEVLKQIQKVPDSLLARAVNAITPEVAEDEFVNLITELTYRRGQLWSMFEEHGGLEGTIEAVYKYLGAQRGLSISEMKAQLNSNQGLQGRAPDIEALTEAAHILATGSDTEREKAALLKDWIDHPRKRFKLVEEYEKIFLTTEGEIRKRLTTKATAAANDALQKEAERVLDGIDAIRTVKVAHGTESLLRMVEAILQQYTQRKRSLNLLDYDDLVHHANRMMKQDNAAGWVLQKLPGDLKHILVDEGQDTNPDQWQLISSIVQEFFTNPARKKSRDNTVFVVGDEKQSIFSFQRADPEEFATRKKLFADLVKKSGGKWHEVTMEIAFRSSPAVTQAVDAVFANPEAADGLFHKDEAAAKRVQHTPFRQGQAGVVEVHPVIRQQSQPVTHQWSMPTEMESVTDTSVELANKIALQIRGWLENGEKLESRDRPISPADIVILVRRRSDFVEHMVRALKKNDIPVAGADRLSLREQIAVMDLVALGETLLFPKDEYKLACVLKSPLIGMTDQQLEDLAIGREEDLWETLAKKAAATDAEKIYKNAYEYLESLRTRVGTERPYEFYSSVLLTPCPANAKSGLLGLYSRLGLEMEDPVVEFLNALENFQQLHVPSLRGFLAWLDAGEAEVKREINLNPEQPRVHIMTVHGAKGLEAPIIILPDTIGVPEDNIRARPRFLWPTDKRNVPLWVPLVHQESRLFTQERTEAEMERDREFRRLLYVAMTRAADRLYVYGTQNTQNRSDKSWYSLIRKGLTENLPGVEKIPVPREIEPMPGFPADTFNKVAVPPSEDPEEMVLRHSVPQTAKPVPDAVKPMEKERVVGIPTWARTPPKQTEPAVEKFRPSQALFGEREKTAPSPLEGRSENYFANLGTVVHALFEFLPTLLEEERESAARSYLAKPARALKEDDQRQTLQQVLSVLRDPEFGTLFGPNSRPEVSINGFIEKDGKKQIMSAQIDRLVVDEKSVLIVDYKNARRVPKDASQVSAEYIVQMAAYKLAVQQIYPDKEVKCALLFTRRAKLVPLPADMMDAALEKAALKPHTPSKKPEGPKA